jgi:hypothetical protein
MHSEYLAWVVNRPEMGISGRSSQLHKNSFINHEEQYTSTPIFWHQLSRVSD